jgi:hypothetical protein
LGLPAGLAAEEVRVTVGRFESALAHSELVAERVDSIELELRRLTPHPDQPASSAEG